METRTYADRRLENMAAVKKRRKKLKRMAIELKGGKCQLCGYDRCIRALEFHHLNPEEKAFALSERGLTRSWASIQQELSKTMLLCANCHREVEDGMWANGKLSPC